MNTDEYKFQASLGYIPLPPPQVMYKAFKCFHVGKLPTQEQKLILSEWLFSLTQATHPTLVGENPWHSVGDH